MEERKSLFDAIKDVCDENDCLHEKNKWLREKIKRLKEEIANREKMRIDCDAYVKKLLKERKELLEEIDNENEIIQSLHDEIEARSIFTKKVIKERDAFCDEMKLMVKDHEEECEDYVMMLKEKVGINDLHLIFSEYIDEKDKESSVTITLFQIMDKIKEYIDKNKE